MARGYRDADMVAAMVAVAFVGSGYLIYQGLRLSASVLGEVVCTYKDLGFAKTATARLLWGGLGLFVGMTVVAVMAALVLPATAAIDAALVCWSFFVWSVIVAVCRWRGAKFRADPGLVDSYVSFGKGQTRRRSG